MASMEQSLRMARHPQEKLTPWRDQTLKTSKCRALYQEWSEQSSLVLKMPARMSPSRWQSAWLKFIWSELLILSTPPRITYASTKRQVKAYTFRMWARYTLRARIRSTSWCEWVTQTDLLPLLKWMQSLLAPIPSSFSQLLRTTQSTCHAKSESCTWLIWLALRRFRKLGLKAKHLKRQKRSINLWQHLGKSSKLWLIKRQLTFHTANQSWPACFPSLLVATQKRVL